MILKPLRAVHIFLQQFEYPSEESVEANHLSIVVANYYGSWWILIQTCKSTKILKYDNIIPQSTKVQKDDNIKISKYRFAKTLKYESTKSQNYYITKIYERKNTKAGKNEIR